MADDLDFDAVLRDVRAPKANPKVTKEPASDGPSPPRSAMERAARPPPARAATPPAPASGDSIARRAALLYAKEAPPGDPIPFGPMGEKHVLEGDEDEALALGRKAAERFASGWDPTAYRMTPVGGTEAVPATDAPRAARARAFLRAKGATEDMLSVSDEKILEAAAALGF